MLLLRNTTQATSIWKPYYLLTCSYYGNFLNGENIICGIYTKSPMCGDSQFIGVSTTPKAAS